MTKSILWMREDEVVIICRSTLSMVSLRRVFFVNAVVWNFELVSLPLIKRKHSRLLCLRCKRGKRFSSYRSWRLMGVACLAFITFMGVNMPLCLVCSGISILQIKYSYGVFWDLTM